MPKAQETVEEMDQGMEEVVGVEERVISSIE